MPYPIVGLHHVTATVDEAQPDLDFCVAALGLRLVKRTVNFDNHHVYHFYYGDEVGTPGTIWTTFPYHGRGVPAGIKGAGQITVTSFSVPAGSLGFWAARLSERGLEVSEAAARFGEESFVVRDPSGLAIELVATGRDQRDPWRGGGVSHGHAVRGLHGVSMVIESPPRTMELLTGVLGFEVVNEMDGRTRLAVNGDAPGRYLEVVHGPGAPAARNGLGTVHHVALAIGSGDEQARLREELLGRGYQVTPFMDRQYFRSIYFREPGGVLLEVATMEPGFEVDERRAELGRSLKLPPWEEPGRAEIEAGLAPIRVPSPADVSPSPPGH
jgi:glyoxalase family protein